MANYPTVDSTTGKYLPNPSRPISYGIRPNVITQTFDSGHEQRRVRGVHKKIFEFKYNCLKLTEYKTIRDFYINTTACGVYSFNWTDPVEKITYNVKFSMDAFQGDYIAHSVNGPYYTLSVKLEQVL